MVSRIIRYVVVAPLNFGINLGLTYSLHDLAKAPEELAFALSLVTVYFINFGILKYFVFRGTPGNTRQQMVKFAVSSLVFRSLEYIGFLVIHTWLGVYYLYVVVGVLVASFVVKFFVFNWIIFKDETDHAVKNESSHRT